MDVLTARDGVRLNYTLSGAKERVPALVMLNGFGQTMVYWHALVPAFAERYTILRYDARGQGKSEVGAEPPTLERHTDDLDELMAVCGIDRCHLVGISHGAQVALAYAAVYPERVGRMVLCSVGSGTTSGTKARIRRWRDLLKTGDLASFTETVLNSGVGSTFRSAHGSVMDGMATALLKRNRPASLQAQLEAILDYPSVIDIARRVQGPSLVMYGKEDELVPETDAKELAEVLGADYLAISDAGHSLPVEAPQIFTDKVLSFLAEA